MNRRSFLVAPAVLAASRAFGQDAPEWFAFEPNDDFTGPSVIGMADWLERPAGKHGFVQVRGDRLAFEDGTPAKFWGTNVCNTRVAPANERADRVADRFAKYGVNLVRMHKFTWPLGRGGIGDPADSTRLDEALVKRWDYLVAGLSRRGIYTAWSHIFGHRLSPADRERAAGYDEIINANLPWDYLRQSSIGLVNFAPDLQDINIALTVNMLNRVNTATGRRYADDPGLAYIELQNEDDIFWGHTQTHLDRCPTYKKMFQRQFSDWLRKKYVSEEKLREAWGEGGLKDGESLDEGTIAARATNTRETLSPRLLDNYQFLHDTQNAFYARFAKAIRTTGFKGAIVGSCWQAGSGVSHYYNLRSDSLTGPVDRHNYSGGTRAMVSLPGSGLLGTGMQQVAGRPFGMSEWKSTWGNPWQAEAPAIIAAYGLGLQGWDFSCEFASDFDSMRNPMTEFGVDSPADMGQYPVLARMVYRGDVREGPLISSRRVAAADLASGKLGFQDVVRQRGDVKEFSGTVPPAALAVGRVEVDFVDRSAPTEAPDLQRWLDTERKIVRSATGQLLWDYSERGFFTIDTPGTQGVVGFAGGREHKLSDVTIALETPFAVVYVASLDRRKSLRQADALLVLAVARTANTGMKVAEGKVVERGKAPVLIEPVRAMVRLHRKERFQVYALDHDGRKRPDAPELAVHEGGFQIDGARYRTLYYLVQMPA